MIAFQNGNIFNWKVSKAELCWMIAFNSKINTNFFFLKKRKRKKAEASVDTAKPLVSFVKSNTWASFPLQKTA